LDLLAFNDIWVKLKCACLHSNVLETQLGYSDKPWDINFKVPQNQLGQLQLTVNISDLVETLIEGTIVTQTQYCNMNCDLNSILEHRL
jgi:hypothetical protein